MSAWEEFEEEFMRVMATLGIEDLEPFRETVAELAEFTGWSLLEALRRIEAATLAVEHAAYE